MTPIRPGNQPSHPLDGPRLKVKWAAVHLDKLDELVDLFARARPYQAVAEPAPEEGLCRWRLQATFPPFLDIHREIGEAIYQLRSALDHVVWQLASDPTPANQFPILASPNEGVFDRMTRTVSDAAKEQIRGLQPYQRPVPTESSLFFLNTLSNIDKHRFMVRPIARLNVPTTDGLRMLATESMDHGDLIAEGPIALYRSGGPDFTFHLSFVVPDAGNVPIENLRTVHEYVQDTVVPAFESFFAEPAE